MCGIETYIDLVDNPLTEVKQLKELEKRTQTQAGIISDLVSEKNKIKTTLKKKYKGDINYIKNQYKKSLRNLKQENREVNKQRNSIKQKYNNLLRYKADKGSKAPLTLQKENETLKKLLNIKRNNTPVPDWLREAVFERDNRQCVECGHKGSIDNPLTVDHRLPRFVGGPNSMENLKTLCEKHNMGKGPGLDETILKEAK